MQIHTKTQTHPHTHTQGLPFSFEAEKEGLNVPHCFGISALSCVVYSSIYVTIVDYTTNTIKQADL